MTTVATGDIAVIIPLHNGARWIMETLASVLAQTHPAKEIIVVDDHSTDEGPAMVKRMPGVRLLSNPSKGGGPARDFGLDASVSPLIAFLDQDDVWSPCHLEFLAPLLDHQPRALAAAANCHAFSGAAPAFGPRPSTVTPRRLHLWHHFPFGLIESPSLVLARREAYDLAGRWSDQTRTVADLELWLHVELHGEFWSSDQVTVARRVHATSFSGTMRSRDVGKYLSTLKKCAAKLLALRNEHDASVAERLRLRASLLDSLHSIALALQASDLAALEQAAGMYESALAAESGEFKRTALANLAWFLDPMIRSHRQAREAWWRLARSQERSTSLLAPWLKESINQWPVPVRVRLLATAPWSTARWKHVANGIAASAGKQTAQLHSAHVDVDGWVPRRCVIGHFATGPWETLRIRVELPWWLPRAPQSFTILCGKGGIQHQCSIKNGIHEIFVSKMPEWRDAASVTIICEHSFALPNDGRERSLRILEVDTLATRQKEPILVKRSNVQKRP